MKRSLFKTIKAEHLKLKKSPVWLAFFILPVISAFFGTMNYVNNMEILKSEWYSLWTQHSLFQCYFFMPALFGTYCSYLWRLEHMHSNWNSFLTAPVPLSSLFLGKLFHAVVMIAGGNAWVFLLYYLCGRFCGLPGALPPEAAGWFAAGTLGGVVVCCVQLFLSMQIHSFAVPIGIALAGSVGGLMITNKGLGLYYPYSLYCMGMRANNPNMELDAGVFLAGCAVYIVFFSAASVIALRRRG